MNTRFVTFVCAGLSGALLIAMSTHSSVYAMGDQNERESFAHNSDNALRAWDTRIDRPRRFVVLAEFRNEAVLDRETQLVWQREPRDQPNTSFFQTSFFGAVRHCYSVTSGGRMGWRLPTAEELTSLLLTETPTSNPAVLRAVLPPGNPFINILPVRYWSISETSYQSTPDGFTVAPNEVEISTVGLETNLDSVHPTWCVRGPGGGQSTRIP
jgi:hypothetical protein